MTKMNCLKTMNLSGRTLGLATAFVVAMALSSTAYGQTPSIHDLNACKPVNPNEAPWIFLCTPVWNLPIMSPTANVALQTRVTYDPGTRLLELTSLPHVTYFAAYTPEGFFNPLTASVSGGSNAIRVLVNSDGSLAGGAGNACGDGGADDFCLTGTVTDNNGIQYGPGVLLRGRVEHFVFKKRAVAEKTYLVCPLPTPCTLFEELVDSGIEVPYDDFEFHVTLMGGDLFDSGKPSSIWTTYGTDQLAVGFFGWNPRSTDPYGPEPYTGDNPFVAAFTEVDGFGYMGPTIITAGLFNAPPSIEAGNSVSGAEGSAIALGGTVSDPDGNTVTIGWTASSPKCSFSAPSSPTTTITCTDNGVYTATLIGSDGVGPPVSDATTVTVANAAPTATVTAPIEGALYPIGSAVTLAVRLSDPGAADTHLCTIRWDDGTASPGTVIVANGNRTCTATHSYSAANVYNVQATVIDDDGASASATVMVVVYDPTAGFITGGGWYNSLPGADVLNPAATGQASFGFVAKYKKGATVPEGATMFQFRAGDLLFQSTAYEWLVVTGGCYAQYKGTGKVNGVPGYSFMFTVRDGRWCAPGTPDGIRVKITGPGGLRYDNARGATDDIGDTSGSVQAIAGGSIVIHR
jgi:hypothetical protein